MKKQGGATGNGQQTQTINVNVGGRSTSINVASAQDAAALTSLLRQLETASNSAA